ncbi:hypothetical protein I79_012208 [Cricetulus griseus]|uniref:Uncharacterized protein n=1 Tax=Cricetulus griseus TaxID=10029 RepID=G3HN74_CRIGR|nr:hypothetical protein I79_012208 [Cricetulus griseus]
MADDDDGGLPRPHLGGEDLVMSFVNMGPQRWQPVVSSITKGFQCLSKIL